MNISSIKQLNERLPYWVKKPFAPMIRRKLIANHTFLEQYEALIRADAMTEEEKQGEQRQLLQQTLRHAYDHTAYYKKEFDERSLKPEDIQSTEDLKRLPILTKKNLAEQYPELQADDMADYYEVSTGGTTGKPIHVMMERDAIYREWAFVYHYWSKFGYDYRTSKLATLRGVNMGKRLCEINPLYREIRLNLFLMNRDNIREYVRAIEKYGADFLYGYPSAVYNFCRLAREAGIPLGGGKFRAALLISENLYPFQEEEIARTLCCPIAMFYGHSERAVFGEKYGEGYIFNPLYGVTEIDEDGAPIVTGFINGKMPLVRYKVDDEVQKIEDVGFEVTGHRNSEIVYGTKGRQFRATALDFHGMISKKLSEFQFIQEIPGELTLKVVKGNATPEEIEKIRVECERKLGEGAVVRVQMVDKLNSCERGGVQIQNACTEDSGALTEPIAQMEKGNQKDEADVRYQITGHWNADILEGKNGEQISAAAINFHDGTFEGAEKYQFVQQRPGNCILNVVPSTGTLSEARIKEIEEHVRQKFGAALTCEVKAVAELETTSRGKYQMVIQKRGGGIRSLTYRILGHRDREVLHGKKGEQISVAAINFHDSTFDLVEGYQFVQEARGRCTLNVLPQRTLDDTQIEAIRRSVNSKLGTAVECEVKVVSKLELSPRGKYCMIIQRNWQ